MSYKFKGGVRCLSILNVVFAIIYGLLAIFLGSSLLTLGSSCSVPLFWCYEISSWGLVILYAGTAFSLRRRVALTIDEGEFGNRSHQGLEMLEANPLEFTPDVERRVNEGFKAWMGQSSDEEDEPEFYNEVPNATHTLSSRQRSWFLERRIWNMTLFSKTPKMVASEIGLTKLLPRVSLLSLLFADVAYGRITRSLDLVDCPSCRYIYI